jgi:hypothetical protein
MVPSASTPHPLGSRGDRRVGTAIGKLAHTVHTNCNLSHSAESSSAVTSLESITYTGSTPSGVFAGEFP